MLFRALLGLFALLVILACGGGGNELGFDSEVIVDIEGLNGATANQLFVSVSPDEGPFGAAEAATTNQSQQWMTRTVNNQFQRFQFYTSSRDVPYNLFIASSVAADRDFRIRISVDGIEHYTRDGLATTTPQIETRIFRNSVDN